jgi:Fe-S oxidoreductase/nitrate reductase gamma subunit
MPIRETFWNIPHWAETAQYILGLVTVLVFLYGIYRHVRRWRMGEAEQRHGDWGKRLLSVLTQAVGQARTLEDPYAGIMHLTIFWGMIVLALGTALATVDWDITRLFFGFQFLTGTFYVIFELVLDIFGLLLLVGLGMACYRRYIMRPGRLQNLPEPGLARDDALVLVGLVLIAITGYLIEGLRIAVVRPEWAAWSPVGNALAGLFTSIGDPTDRGLHVAIWTFHTLVAFSLIASLPYTKLFHIVGTPLNIFLRSFQPAGMLAPARTHSSPGVEKWQDFTWKQLLDLDACTRCGRCQDQCPAFASGLRLSPRDLILKLHAQVWAPGNGHTLHGDVIPSDELWACTTCRACSAVCPAFIDQVAAIVDLRRYLVDQGEVDNLLQDALAKLGRYGNSFGQSERMRARWTQSLSFKIKDARREPVEYLWFTGDYVSYNATLSGAARMTAEVFQAAGLDFGILYDAERNAGNDVRRVGEEGLFEMLVEKNLAAMERCDYRVILTTDPHSYNTLKNEYPSFQNNGSGSKENHNGTASNGNHPVLHYTELLDQLITSGQLKLSKRLNGAVTYHDPCYLGRYNNVFEAPRQVIAATGHRLIEMPRHGDRALCCGAGGGRIWMEEQDMKERPSEARVREAAAVDNVQALVVTCPKDLVMFKDAVKTTGLEGQLAVKDLIELVHEAI